MAKRKLTKQEIHNRAVARNEIKRAIGTLPAEYAARTSEVTLAFEEGYVIHPELQGIDPVALSSLTGPTAAERAGGAEGETVITIYVANILKAWASIEFIFCEQAANAYLVQFERYVGVPEGTFTGPYFQ